MDSEDCAFTVKNVEKEKINAKITAAMDLISEAYP
jgi:hypothetical protein